MAEARHEADTERAAASAWVRAHRHAVSAADAQTVVHAAFRADVASWHLPWTCAACTAENASYPSVCEVCDAANPAYGREATDIASGKISAPAAASASKEDAPTEE